MWNILFEQKKNKLFNFAEKLFASYGLPVYLNIKKININKVKLAENIYKNIFLDKKKISQYPRYISLKKQGKPSINEIKDFDFINDTILNVLLIKWQKKKN